MQKTFVITGGSTGIGFACAKYLTDLNYHVIITGKNPDNLDKAVSDLGSLGSGIVADSASLKDTVDLVQKVKRQSGQIDGLFINAGIFKARYFAETTEELFDETMNVNFKGAFFTIQHFLPVLKNPASIVLNTSVVVFKTFAGTSAYTASKCALDGIAKVLNVELAERGIRVNVVCPGVTESPIQKKSGMTDAAIADLMNHLSSTSPMGRVVQPNDIAPVVEFLLSDKSLPLRNEKIIVDGGTTL